jgi:hypothetical protein
LTRDELEAAYLRALAHEDMRHWRARTRRENLAFIPDAKDMGPMPRLKSEASYQRIMRAVRTSPEYLERNT